MTQEPNSTFPTTPISTDGPLPKARLDDARKAQEIYWNMHQASKGRNAYGAYLQGLVDGNPPYRQSSLRQSGQGWRANFNTGEAKARKDTAKTPYYDLFSAGSTYCQVRTTVKEQLDSVTASEIIGDEFSEMLRKWAGFDLNFWKCLDDFVGFGRGWLFWPTSDSWHFKRIPWWRVRFPDGTDVDPEDWEMFSIEHVFDPINLNSYIRDDSSDSGWNSKQVRKALMDATPLQPDSAEDSMLVQQMIRDQDIALMYRSSTIQAASIYVKEWDGSWSRMIVQIGKDKTASVELGKDDWIYYKRGVAENIHQLVAAFMFEVENGSVNGLGGLLRDIADQVKVKNRMRCEQVNNVFLRTTVLMQAANASSRVKGGLITVGGGVTLIPEGMQIQQSTILGDIESTLAVGRDMASELDMNTGIFRPQMEKPQGNPEPLGTTQLRYAQASVLTNSAVNRFQQQLDWFYTELYRRASMDLPKSDDPGIEAAQEFQKRCKERGVSEKQLRKVDWVRAIRVIGNGSPAMRQQLTGEIAQFLPVLGLGQRGMKNLGQMIISARGGQDMVERLMPMEDQAEIPTVQDREAMQENGMIKIGTPVVVIENDDSIVHLKRHFEAGFAAANSVQQGGNPSEAAAFIQGVLPHIGEHIQNLKNPQEQKQAMETAKQLQSMGEQIVQMIQESQPDPEAQQQVMSDIQLKQLDTQSRIQDRAVKTQAALKDKEVKSRHNMALSNAEASQRMALNDAEIAAKISRETALARTKLTQNRNGE